MSAPSVQDVKNYLGDEASSDADVSSAFAAEKASQALRCKVPADAATWPADLTEALCRRVQHNLAVRKNALGVQVAQSEFGSTQLRVGGLDAEVRRLEAPFRRRTVG